MIDELHAIFLFIKKLYTLQQIHKWEREARKASRMYAPYRAEFALERIEALSREL